MRNDNEAPHYAKFLHPLDTSYYIRVSSKWRQVWQKEVKVVTIINSVKSAFLTFVKFLEIIWSVLLRSEFRAVVCIVCLKDKQNPRNSTDVFLLWYFHLHVSVDNQAFFRVTYVLQLYRVIISGKLIRSIQNHMIICFNSL
jgi:hypothetical protein